MRALLQSSIDRTAGRGMGERNAPPDAPPVSSTRMVHYQARRLLDAVESALAVHTFDGCDGCPVCESLQAAADEARQALR